MRVSPSDDPSPTASLLDDRLAWPLTQWQTGGPWRLGEGLCVVGPGWHPLVRAAFAIVAETPGASITEVKQKCGQLRVHPWHENPDTRQRLHAAMTPSYVASFTTCEGCGQTLPHPESPGVVVWRRHCDACTAWLAADGGRTERALWEARAGYAWPAFEGS